MALARLVVIEGPDLGQEYAVPLRGGGIGRGDGNVVQLTDLAVSRQHCQLELRGGAMHVVDDSGKGRTLVNGQAVATHALHAGDEIVVGKTRLAYLPEDGAVAMTQAAGRVTIEVSSRELMSLVGTGSPAETRARRHLASLAGLGDRLRIELAAGRDAAARAACDAALAALGADRVFLLARDGGRWSQTGSAATAGDPLGAQLNLPRGIVERALGEGKAIAIDAGDDAAPRTAIAVPIATASGELAGLLWIERRGAAPWDTLDVMAASCLAQLSAAALASADSRDQLVKSKAVLEERLGDGDFVGQSAAARRILDFVARVAPSDATVLLTGESGSGKEMVARAIHKASRRHGGPCVAVNCAALTESLIESELFGHEKGAFTGATDKKLGRFEMADKGTLFLDEIGEMPLELQTKFLRVLEERRFERVGGSRSITVDVRVVAATNRDLAEMARRGQFREDLYYRLSVIHTEVPALRERVDDIPILAEHFLAKFRGQAGRRVSGFSADALRALCAHPWPGNVRELRNAVERAIVLGSSEWIAAADLPPPVVGQRRTSTPTPPLGSLAVIEAPAALPRTDAGAPSSAAKSLRDLEKEGILAALAATGGNKAQAAAILEIDRSTLYKKLKDYGIG